MGIVHSAKVLLLRFQWVLVHSLLLCPGPRLLLYWNLFVQHGTFVTFLIELNFLFQHYHGKVFFWEGGLGTCVFLFFSSFPFYFINLWEGGMLALMPLYLPDFR